MTSTIKMCAIKCLRLFLLPIAQDTSKILATVIMTIFVFVGLMVVVSLLNIVTIDHANKVPLNASRRCLLTKSAKALICIAIKEIFDCAKTKCPSLKAKLCKIVELKDALRVLMPLLCAIMNNLHRNAIWSLAIGIILTAPLHWKAVLFVQLEMICGIVLPAVLL